MTGTRLSSVSSVLAFCAAALWLAPSIVRAQGVTGTVAAGPGEQDDPRERFEVFYQQRAFPFDRIPAGALQSAVAQLQSRWPQTRTGRSAPMFSAFVSPAAWSALGPAPISGAIPYSGRINSIAIDPTNTQTIYVGTATGGVWKTTTGGAAWTPLTDNECGLAMGSVVLDPVNPQIVYAGTGEANGSIDSYQGCGVLISTNGGASWTQSGAGTFVASTGPATIFKMLVDPATAGSTTTTVVFAASWAGLYRSANSGATWTNVLNHTVSDIVATPTPGEYYAAGWGGGVYKSTDAGLTWTKLAGLPTANLGRIALASPTAAPVVVYATIENSSSGSLLGVWMSSDGGTTWAQLTASGASCSGQCWYDMYLAVDPATPSTLWFGGLYLYKSSTAGATFTDVTFAGTSVHVDHHAIAFDPQTPTTVFSANDGGLWRSTNSGTTWTSLNTNLSVTQFYPGISVNPTVTTEIIGGTQDNGTEAWSGTPAWSQIAGGDGSFTAIDPAGVTRYISFTPGSSSRRVYRFDNTGWQFKGLGLDADNAYWTPPLVMDPVNSSVLYYGTYRLWRTANRGDSWATFSAGLLSGTTSGITTIAIAPADTNTIYVGGSDGTVSMTANHGVTWTNVTSGLPLRFISRIAVDPLDTKTAWLTVSGYNSGHVFKTTNAGASWTDISYNLPNVPVSAVTMQRGSREIDVATDIGVFALPLGASSWTPLAASMPNVPVIDLVYDGPRGRLIAGTHGRGMFALATSSAVLRGNITNSGTLTALDAQVILAAVVGLPLPAGATRYPNGDANCDGDVTAVDALLVLSKVVGLNTLMACVGTIR
jgi:photosystem II stability/assembly factor-like uncharacterized protein